MEFLTANLSGKVRRETWLGRAWLVAPAVSIVPGVLPGSQGAGLYPEDETSRYPEAWDVMPVTNGHPTIDGKHVSARRPGVLEKFGVGQVFESVYNGKLRHELWVDEERARQVEPRIVHKLLRGEKIELSTGLFIDRQPGEGVFNGRKYAWTARNYRPDHIAILLDEKGACSLQDGCGLNVNESVEITRDGDGQLQFQPAASTDRGRTENQGATDMDRKATISYLTANCDCWKGGDEVLNQLPDDRLAALKKHAEEEQKRRAVANAASKGVKVGELTLAVNSEGKAVLRNDDGEECPADDAECLEKMKVKKKGKPAMNAETPLAPAHKPPTLTEWLATAPPEIQSVVANAVQIEREQKADIVGRLTANLDGDAKQRLAARLQNKPLDELRDLLALAPASREAQGTPAALGPLANYFGAAGAAPATAKDDSDNVLPYPTVNFDDETAKRKQA